MMWPYGVRTFRSHRGRAGPAAPRGATSSSSTASPCRERARRSTSTARSTVFAAGAAILCYMAISPAEAHDASHPELDGWYEKLESGKGPCCDGSDSAHVEPSDWETQNKPRSHGHRQTGPTGPFRATQTDSCAAVSPCRPSNRVRRDGSLIAAVFFGLALCGPVIST